MVYLEGLTGESLFFLKQKKKKNPKRKKDESTSWVCIFGFHRTALSTANTFLFM